MSVMTDSTKVRSALLGGRAILTLASIKTGTHFTYQITAAKNSETRFFVGLLSGPNNDADYVYIGCLEDLPAGLTFRLTRASKVTEEASSVRGFNFFVRHLNHDNIPSQLEVRHEGRCCRCARTLTTPESVDTGFGPECSARLGIAWERQAA